MKIDDVSNSQMVGGVLLLSAFLFALTRIKTFFVKDVTKEVDVLRDRLAALEGSVAKGDKATDEKLDGILEAIRAGHDASRTAHEELRRSMDKGFKEAAAAESGKRSDIHRKLNDHAQRLATLEAKA